MKNRNRVAVIAAASIVSAAIIAQASGAQTVIQGWSIATAYVAFALLAVSLSLGPLNVIRRRHNPVHIVLRRDLGVTGGIAAIVHTVLGLQVHMGGSLARYFALSSGESASSPGFIAANYIGLVSAAVLAFVVAISNNIAIRRFGLARWKRWQRLAYVAAIAAALHGLLYQAEEERVAWAIALVVLVSLTVIGLQIAGSRFLARGVNRDDRPPARQ